MRCALTLGMLLVLIVALPASSEAAFTSPPILLSPAGQDAGQPQVGVDADGDALAAWARFDGTGSCSASGCLRIQARSRSATGTLGTTATLSAAGQNADQPQVATGANGTSTIVWRRFDGTSATCCFRIGVAGSLGAIQTLSAGAQNADQPQVAADADGDALAVWQRFDGTTQCGGSPGCLRIQARPRSAGGTLGTVQTLSDAGQRAEQAQVAIDADGDALAVWARYDGTGPCSALGCLRIEARTRSATGTLGPVESLSAPGQTSDQPQVALDAAGDALVVWRRPTGTTQCGGLPGCFRIQARARPAAGTFGPVETLSPAGQSADEPQLGVDGSGNALVIWRRPDGTTQCGGPPGCFRIQARARSVGGTLGSVQTLSAAGQSADQAQVGVDGDGDAVTVWMNSAEQTQARTRSAAGTLGSVQTLSFSAAEPQVAVNAGGNALAVWRRFNLPNDRIQAAAGP